MGVGERKGGGVCLWHVVKSWVKTAASLFVWTCVCWLFALSLSFVRECIRVSGWGWSRSSYMVSDCVDRLSVPHRLW